MAPVRTNIRNRPYQSHSFLFSGSETSEQATNQLNLQRAQTRLVLPGGTNSSMDMDEDDLFDFDLEEAGRLANVTTSSMSSHINPFYVGDGGELEDDALIDRTFHLDDSDDEEYAGFLRPPKPKAPTKITKHRRFFNRNNPSKAIGARGNMRQEELPIVEYTSEYGPDLWDDGEQIQDADNGWLLNDEDFNDMFAQIAIQNANIARDTVLTITDDNALRSPAFQQLMQMVHAQQRTQVEEPFRRKVITRTGAGDNRISLVDHVLHQENEGTRQGYVQRALNQYLHTERGVEERKDDEENEQGDVSTVTLWLERRTWALSYAGMASQMITSLIRTQPHLRGKKVFLRMEMRGGVRNELNLNLPFIEIKDFGSNACVDYFIKMYLRYMNSPKAKAVKRAQADTSAFHAEMNDPNDLTQLNQAPQDLYREPIELIFDLVVPPPEARRPPPPPPPRDEDQQPMDEDQGPQDNGPDQDEEEEETRHQRGIRAMRRGIAYLHSTRNTRSAQGSGADSQGRRYSRRLSKQPPKKYVGGVLCQYEGSYTIFRDRDPLIYTPPPSTLKLSVHAKKRQREKTRRVVIDHQTVPWNELRGVGVGAYELNDPHEQLLYERSILHLYARKGLMHPTPQTASKSCFLMAFIRCEGVGYKFSNVGHYQQKRRLGYDEVGPPLPANRDGRYLLECTLPEWSELDRDYSFVYYDEEKENYYLKVLCRYMEYSTEYQQYQLELSEREIYFWELAARELEIQLTLKFPDVDVNCLQSIGQCVSNFFQICISIYDVELFGSRVWCFQPEGSIYHLIIQNDYELPVASLVYDHGHMFGLCNLMKYLSQDVKNQVDWNAYCPFCESKGTRALRKNETSIQHIDSCWQKYKYEQPCMKIYTLKENQMKELEMGVKPVKLEFCSELKRQEYCCIYCHQPVTQSSYIHHQCVITCAKKDAILDNKQLIVYDLEAAQILVPNTENTYYHVCNWVCARYVYPETEEEKKGWNFDNEYAFMDYVMEHLKDVVIIAHNGGSYDHQFVVRYLERLKIPHTFIPSPTSMHKFLSVHIPEKNIQFLDFIYFLPGSLRKISESMSIEMHKGDFPHKFNNQIDLSYEGRIPPMDTEEDYWCLETKKDEQEVMELKEFYREQTLLYCTCERSFPSSFHVCTQCRKRTWVMKEVIQHYCMQDVIVLGACCAKYREQLLEIQDDQQEGQVWLPTNIDPFQYLTVPQLALNILISGYQEGSPFMCMKGKLRTGQTLISILWMEMLMEKQCCKILHRGNHTHEYYDFELQQFADGYDPVNAVPYICLDCEVWGCENCHSYKMHYEPTLKHPFFRNMNYLEVYELTEGIIYQWKEKGGVVIRICEVLKVTGPQDVYLKKCHQLLPMNNFFYGGRTEVFQLYFNARLTPHEKLQYHDVCSLYPYVCAFKELPNGIPEYILGYRIEKERLFHSDPQYKYWGYISCRVRPNPKCVLGLLPQRCDSGHLRFSLEEQDGCWGLEELELAMRQGYQLLEVYGVIHWGPDQRSDTLFRPYVNFFLRMKQESEGWKKLGAKTENPTEQEMNHLAEMLFESNGGIGKVRIASVRKNPVKRLLAKLFLNSLWGKFAQKPQNKMCTTVYGMQEFLKLFCDKTIPLTSIQFRQTNQDIFKVQYEVEDQYVRANMRGNMFLAAKVTEHARCILHQQMLRIGPERIIYCDTDSLVFHWPKDGEDLTGIGLGKWTNEFPNDEIETFYACAPKFYLIELANHETHLKIKGVQASIANVRKMGVHAFQDLIEDGVCENTTKEKKVWLDYMSIFSNCQRNLGVAHGVLMTRYGKKAARLVISKRVIQRLATNTIDWENLIQIRTHPFM